MTNTNDFEDRVHDWWIAISKDPGKRKELRHEPDATGIWFCEPFYELVRRLPWIENLDTLACVAMAVVHIDEDSESTVAERMGRKKKGSEDPTVSDQRFRRLIACDREEAARELIRILPMIDRTGNVRNLAKTIFYWDNPNQFSKKAWMEEYYLANDRKAKETEE